MDSIMPPAPASRSLSQPTAEAVRFIWPIPSTCFPPRKCWSLHIPRYPPRLPACPATLLQAQGASIAEMDALLAAAHSGSAADVEAALRPHFLPSDLVAGLTRALLCGNCRAAAALLRHTKRLPQAAPGQSGSVASMDAAMADTVHQFVADGGLAATGGWGSWGLQELCSARALGLRRTAAALVECGAAASDPLHIALQQGQPLSQVQRLATRANASTADGLGRTPLHVLAESTHMWECSELPTLVERLLELGASLVAQDADGCTPLMTACSNRRAATMRPAHGLKLLSLLACPDSLAQANQRGLTPMQHAAEQGDYHAVIWLWQEGCADDAAMESALAAAVKAADLKEAAVLRLLGAPPSPALNKLAGLPRDDPAYLLMSSPRRFKEPVLLRMLSQAPCPPRRSPGGVGQCWTHPGELLRALQAVQAEAALPNAGALLASMPLLREAAQHVLQQKQ